MIYLRNTSQNRRRESTLFKLNIKAVHNCSAIRDASPIADKDTKKKNKNKKGVARGQTWFRPNLSNSPPLSVSSLLFLCFTVVRECDCTKKAAMLQITVFVI